MTIFANSSYLRSMLVIALVLASQFSLGQSARAQATTVEGVTVTVPRPAGRSPTTGAPIRDVAMSQAVSLSDLDLNTPVGASELKKRVSDTAGQLCRKLNARYPVGAPDVQTCTTIAVKRAEGQVQAAILAARQSSDTSHFVVYFPFDESVITPEALAVMQAAANYASARHATRVIVVGHTDTSGSNIYNAGLSERRAKAAASALAGLGVSQSAISVEWKGEAAPAVGTENNVKEPLNRRATIDIKF